MIIQNEASQKLATPDKAIKLLKDGNSRFISKTPLERDYIDQVGETSKGKFPLAVIISCVDYRVPPEIIFDQGIGDIYSTRIAGNIVNEDILGSIEFACKLKGAKLIVVMGHTDCGAVMGACDNVELGNLTGLLEKLKPAVDKVETDEGTERSSKNSTFVNNVALKNIELTIENIKKKSNVLIEMFQNKEIYIVGAMYSVETGKVNFLD